MSRANKTRRQRLITLFEESSDSGIPSGFPDANNTGVQSGITLTPVSNVTINASGVYENKDVTGDSLVINANNVTVRNCRITAAENAVVYVAAGKTGVIIEYCDVVGIPGSGGAKGVWVDTANGVEIRYCDISGVEDGLYAFGNGTYFHDNYVHDQLSQSGDPHYDCVQFSGTGIVIEHNTMLGILNSNSCAQFGNHTGPIEVTFNNNLMRPGPNALVLFNCDDDTVGVSCVYHITNNRMEPGHINTGNKFVIWDVNPPATWTGNVNVDTGEVIPAP